MTPEQKLILVVEAKTQHSADSGYESGLLQVDFYSITRPGCDTTTKEILIGV